MQKSLKYTLLAACITGAVAIALRFAVFFSLTIPVTDAIHFSEVAQNIADGQGHVTYISKFHQGLPDFPSRSQLYPVTPWVLSVLFAHVDADRASAFFALLIHIVCVLSTYVLVTQTIRAEQPDSDLPLVRTFGLFGAAAFALHCGFFASTNFTTSDGLGYLVFTLALVLFGRFNGSRLASHYHIDTLALGVLCGLAYNIRTQSLLIVCGVALYLLLGITSRVAGGRTVRTSLTRMALFFVAVSIGLFLFRGAFLGFEYALPESLLFFEETEQAIPDITPVGHLAATESAGQFIWHRVVHGLTALLPGTSQSHFTESFGIGIYLYTTVILVAAGSLLQSYTRDTVASRQIVAALRPSLFGCVSFCYFAALFGMVQRLPNTQFLYGTRFSIYLVPIVAVSACTIYTKLNSEAFRRAFAVLLISSNLFLVREIVEYTKGYKTAPLGLHGILKDNLCHGAIQLKKKGFDMPYYVPGHWLLYVADCLPKHGLRYFWPHSAMTNLQAMVRHDGEAIVFDFGEGSKSGTMMQFMQRPEVRSELVYEARAIRYYRVSINEVPAPPD